MGFVDRSTRMVIRLAKRGCVNRPFYLIVVQKNRAPRDRKISEQIGTFDPLPNINNEKLVAINYDRLRFWLAQGASTSTPISQLLGLAGYFPIHPTTKLKAFRLQRKLDEEIRLKEEQKQTETQAGESAS